MHNSQNDHTFDLCPEDSSRKKSKLKKTAGTLFDTFSTELPSAIQPRFTTACLIALTFLLAGVILAISLRNIQYTGICIFSLYFLYIGYVVKSDFKKGKIIETVLICSSVISKISVREANVVFRTDDEIPSYYTFRVPKKQSENFVPNVTYLIYFSAERSSIILGYEQL